MVIDRCRPLHVHCIKLYLNNSQKYKNACVAGSKYTIGIFDSAGQVSTLLKKKHRYILVVFDSLTGIFFEPKLIIYG
jgi:hypothetical protein